MFDSAADRIAYSQAVDYLDQGRADLIPPETVEDYVKRGLLERHGGGLRLTPEGEREFQSAKTERSTDG
ncbi:hypothetical protein [Caldimonas brevitalea]|uniref:Uncharacterized protein n=1 Tax=Caldimonas brevitalea TaxID=413882 RepID=A0A0G3BLK0_9BURK|nr:hypothetical protein [Caldimonas brevitalea]AKJ28863.1 hypothetical protein AAW51_2172 [Caldimonas brevitalea]